MKITKYRCLGLRSRFRFGLGINKKTSNHEIVTIISFESYESLLVGFTQQIMVLQWWTTAVIGICIKRCVRFVTVGCNALFVWRVPCVRLFCMLALIWLELCSYGDWLRLDRLRCSYVSRLPLHWFEVWPCGGRLAPSFSFSHHPPTRSVSLRVVCAIGLEHLRFMRFPSTQHSVWVRFPVTWAIWASRHQNRFQIEEKSQWTSP